MSQHEDERARIPVLLDGDNGYWLASLLRSLDYVPVPDDGYTAGSEEGSADGAPLVLFAGGTENTGEVDAALAAWAAPEHPIPLVLVEPAPDEASLGGGRDKQVIGRIAEPFPISELVILLQQARLWHQSVGADGDLLFRGLVGPSPAVERVRNFVARVAPTPATVLITGETGTGKEVVARNVHGNSKRAHKPFVAVNCGAIPGELLESELFGHEKGAFTGAVSARRGRFELADGGTLFLDEIGEMPPAMQVKLLRVLQDGAFERVGGQSQITADIRLITATNRDIEAMVEDGTFREDLYYRINVCPVRVPALRDRLADMGLLMSEIQSRLATLGYPTIRISRAAYDVMRHWAWPGNVRELVNLLERLSVLYPHQWIETSHLPRDYLERAGYELPALEPEPNPLDGEAMIGDSPNTEADDQSPVVLPAEGIDLRDHLAQIECEFIRQALDEAEGVTARAAETLGLRRTTLAEKMRKYGIGKEQTATGS